MGMRRINKLFFYKNPYDLTGTEGLFVDAMRDNADFQYKNCADYKRILDSRGFTPADLRTIDDLDKLPFIPTAFLKRHHMFSMPERRMVAKATSSGTSGGGFSKVGLELSALLRTGYMSLKMVKDRGLFTLRPCNYIMFGYKPHRTNKMAVTQTARATRLLAPTLHVTYALKSN